MQPPHNRRTVVAGLFLVPLSFACSDPPPTTVRVHGIILGMSEPGVELHWRGEAVAIRPDDGQRDWRVSFEVPGAEVVERLGPLEVIHQTPCGAESIFVRSHRDIRSGGTIELLAEARGVASTIKVTIDDPEPATYTWGSTRFESDGTGLTTSRLPFPRCTDALPVTRNGRHLGETPAQSMFVHVVISARPDPCFELVHATYTKDGDGSPPERIRVEGPVIVSRQRIDHFFEDLPETKTMVTFGGLPTMGFLTSIHRCR